MKFVPPTLEDCVQFGASIGLSQLESEKFFFHHDSAGWRVKGRSMANWKSGLQYWKRNTRTEGGPAESIWSMTKRLEIMEAEFLGIKNRGHQDNWGWHSANDKDKARFIELKAKIKELKARIAG